jgi:hypothetical protein
LQIFGERVVDWNKVMVETLKLGLGCQKAVVLNDGVELSPCVSFLEDGLQINTMLRDVLSSSQVGELVSAALDASVRLNEKRWTALWVAVRQKECPDLLAP